MLTEFGVRLRWPTFRDGRRTARPVHLHLRLIGKVDSAIYVVQHATNRPAICSAESYRDESPED